MARLLRPVMKIMSVMPAAAQLELALAQEPPPTVVIPSRTPALVEGCRAGVGGDGAVPTTAAASAARSPSGFRRCCSA